MLLHVGPLDKRLQLSPAPKEHGPHSCLDRLLPLRPHPPLHSDGTSIQHRPPGENRTSLQTDWMLIRDDEGNDVAFLLILISAAILGGSDGLLDGSFTGIATYLPFEYFQARYPTQQPQQRQPGTCVGPYARIRLCDGHHRHRSCHHQSDVHRDEGQSTMECPCLFPLLVAAVLDVSLRPATCHCPPSHLQRHLRCIRPAATSVACHIRR